MAIHRLPFDVSDEAFTRLERSLATTDISTKSEYLRRAVDLYEVLITFKAEGWTRMRLERDDDVLNIPLSLLLPHIVKGDSNDDTAS